MTAADVTFSKSFHRWRRPALFWLWIAALVFMRTGTAQIMEGELRVTVRDPSGRAVAARIELVGRNPQFRTESQADSAGQARLPRLPSGVYRMGRRAAGFEEFVETVEIRSAIPQLKEITLKLGPVETEITVQATAPLMDPSQPGQVMQRGREQLEQTLGTTPGRSTVDVITTMPGWLVEANAVL